KEASRGERRPYAMPAARPATAPRPRPRRPPQPRARRKSRRAAVSPLARVRWDRIGRTALLIVLAVVAGLYIQHTIDYFITRSNADAQHAIVRDLARQNASLRAQARALQQPNTIKRYARTLGMVKTGERPYVVIGLPSSAATMARRHERR